MRPSKFNVWWWIAVIALAIILIILLLKTPQWHENLIGKPAILNKGR